MPLFFYCLASFLMNTLVFMMNDLPILTPTWLAGIVLGVMVMFTLDKMFLEEEE